MPETFPMNLENESEVASSPSKHRCYLREICIFFPSRSGLRLCWPARCTTLSLPASAGLACSLIRELLPDSPC